LKQREILFRGKRIDNGEWVYGNLNYGTIGIKSIKDSYYISDFDVNPWDKKFYPVIHESVGQYTGLTDKNGKKIFESDCFKTYCTGLPVYKHIVGYYPEHFAFMARCIEMNTVHYLSDYRPSAIEVIGNIHDNPELLEVKE
jgi:uncharacterized phage protein (TIGR01671 family)